jgi:transposase
MVVVDGQGIPLGNYLESASPAEVTLIETTLDQVAVPRSGRGRPRKNPERLIYDKAADSDPLRARLARRGIELICPHRKNRKKPPTQDGRALRRYKRRWKVERTFSWWGNFRRLLIRWEYHMEMYQAFVNVACLLIVLRQL